MNGFNVFAIPFLCSVCLFSQVAKSRYDETLPQGVRLLGMKYVKTGKIDSSYGNNNREKNYYLKENLDAETLSSANESLAEAMDVIKKNTPQAYKKMSLGEFQGRGEANVEVRAIGAAVGITDRLTAYASVPYYRARVRMPIEQTKKGNLAQVSKLMKREAGDKAYINSVAQAVEQIPGASGELLQSVLVNKFDYEPAGNWRGEGLGDTELGMIYRLVNKPNWGLAVSGGAILPTGRTDNPDVLQDFSFGDGQTDAFLEFGGGLTLFRQFLGLDSYVRYTYQFAEEKELRVPENEDFFLTDRKGTVREKLGNKWRASFKVSLFPTSWITPYSEYLQEVKGSDRYQTPYGAKADRLMAKDTRESAQFVKVGLNLSSVKLFQQGKFAAPVSLDLSARSMIEGRNRPKYTRFDIDLRFFF